MRGLKNFVDPCHFVVWWQFVKYFLLLYENLWYYYCDLLYYFFEWKHGWFWVNKRFEKPMFLQLSQFYGKLPYSDFWNTIEVIGASSLNKWIKLIVQSSLWCRLQIYIIHLLVKRQQKNIDLFNVYVNRKYQTQNIREN